MAGTATSVASLGTNWVSQVYADAFTVFRANNVMGNLVTTFNDRTGDEARASSTYNQITAGTVAETDDITSELEFNKTNVATLTVKELGYISFLTDRRIETDQQNAQADLSLELGNAAADKVESDLLANFSSFTGGTIGTGGTGDPMTWGKLFAARTALKSTKVAGPYIAVLHENAWHQLAKAASVATSTRSNAPDSLLEAVKSQWYVGTYGDISIFTTANIAAGTAVTQAVFTPQAAAIDWRRGVRLETQRDASRRGTEFVISAKYATGVWRPKAGCKLISDASLPTS
jgi:hypothetical protein